MDNQAIAQMLKKQEQILIKIEKNLSTPQQPTKEVDVEQIESLTANLATSIERVDKVVEEARKPVVQEHRHAVDIASKGVITLIVMLTIAVVILASSLYFVSRPNYDQRDNDLKYRYIKMKGEATSTTISDLEEIFNLNRDNTQIREMLRTVEAYEEAVRKRAIADEQARLRQQESAKLNREATELKAK